MTDDEADKYYNQWLTAKAQGKLLKEEITRRRAALERAVDDYEAFCMAQASFMTQPLALCSQHWSRRHE